MEIEINGLKYRQKEQNNQQTTRKSRMSVMLMGMAMMFGAQGSIGTSKRQRKTPKVNIVEEFKLIQKKKSKLSRKDRDWVVFKFNRYYEIVS